MTQPFNPSVFNQSGIANGQSAADIMCFSGEKLLGTEAKGVFWQSSKAKKFGRAVKLFIHRRQKLASKLNIQESQDQQVISDLGLNKRSVTVVSQEQCKNLVNRYQENPINLIHQTEIDLLEAFVTNNENEVNKALNRLQALFQLYFPDDWQEKYEAFLQNESKEILRLGQAHTDQGFFIRMVFGKPKFKQMMLALDKKIIRQQEALKKLKQDHIIQHQLEQSRTRRPAQEQNNTRQPLNRRAVPVINNHLNQLSGQNVPEPRTEAQKKVSVPVAKESKEIKQQLAFEIVRDRSRTIKTEDYPLAMEYGLLNSEMVETLLQEGDISQAVQTFTDLVQALRPEVQVSHTPVSAEEQHLIARLRLEKDVTGHPLFQSEDEFRQLFAELPDGSVSIDKAASSLKLFRKLQHYQDMIGVRFTPDMYSILLHSNALEDDAMELNPAELDADVYAQLNTPEKRTQMRREALLNAFNTVGKYKDVVPEKTAIDQIREADMQPYASGLYNWGNNCFMNASMQMIAAEMATPELSDVVLDYRPTGLTEDQTMLYLQLLQSFLNVCDAINDRSRRPVALVSLQRQFMQDYLRYSQATGRQSAPFILADQQPDNLRPALIPQQDPHEFLNDLADIFGLSHHPKCSVHLYDHKKMIYQDQEKLRKTDGGDQNAILPIALNRQSPKTINRCVSAHLSEEKLNEFNQFKWDRADKARAGLTDRDQVDTLKQQVFVSAGQQPPERLMLQMKIFEFEGGRANKLNEEAANLMSYSGNRVRIPIAQSPDSEPENHEYQMTSIVCHRGSSSTSGHYVSLRFEGDHVIVCDDDVVLELNEYARFRGRPPYKNWKDFCAKEKLSGYLFSLKKV